MFPLHTLVWMRQEGFPWWPAITAAPAEAGVAVPEGAEGLTCVVCYPSTASSVAFVAADDLRAFRGDAADADLITAAAAVEDCAAAVREAQGILASLAGPTAAQAEGDSMSAAAAEAAEVAVTGGGELGRPGTEEDDEYTALMEKAINITAGNNAAERGEQANDDEDDGDGDEAEGAEAQAESEDYFHDVAEAKKHKKEKKHKKDKKDKKHKKDKDKEKKKEKEKKDRKRARGDSDDSDHNSDVDKEREEEEEDEDYLHETSARAARAGKQKQKRERRRQRQSRLEEFGKDKRSGGIESDNENDSDSDNDRSGGGVARARQAALEDDDEAYYYERWEGGRQLMTDEALREAAASISEAAVLWRKTFATSAAALDPLAAAVAAPADKERAHQTRRLLRLLHPLARVDVTYEQLASTGIGAAVGALLPRVFPYSVTVVAGAVLNYWFASLPAAIRAPLVQVFELDACSARYVASSHHSSGSGSRTSEDGKGVSNVGATGVKLFEAFTDEELEVCSYQHALRLCKAMEAGLSPETRSAVVDFFASASDDARALRSALLRGAVTPEEVCDNALDLRAFLQRQTERVASPTSPGSPGVLGGFSSPTTAAAGQPGFEETSLYACPKCGSTKAQRRAYSVQAHDSYPDILVCLSCGHGWNLAENL